jgi:hypothetical protein
VGLEGLEYILNKREVVPTVSSLALLERPEQVENDYRRHVRTYVPISRAAAGDGDQMSVEKFEQRAIQQVTNARAPRGYITADYGYGKTSTALYLWQRAEEASLLVVPPFQLLELSNLIDAAHGWARHRFLTVRRDLVPRLDALYDRTTAASIEAHARESGSSEAVLRRWVREGRFTLALQTADYLRYFTELTDLAREAGYKGVIILPDEIQQYIEPKIKSNAGDPIAPFFNLIQGLATREGYLNFGFIMVIPLKEIGVIRDARGRGDLLQRMRGLSLDLSTVYDQAFATRLWERLAREFDFDDIADDIVRPETLAALGQIASRPDLSHGPRTVINAFRRMVEHYQGGGHAYSPIDLIEDMLNTNIQQTGNEQIPNVARRALQSSLVRGRPDLSKAIKLAAAYPNDGASRDVQRHYHTTAAFEELHRVALGDLVIAVGPIEQGGFTLTGLDRVNLTVDWLPQTIRDFRRFYGEAHDDTRDRALEVFTRLLKDRVFRSWKVIEEAPRTLTGDRAIVFQGDFQSFASRYPNRQVKAKVFWAGETPNQDDEGDDVVIEYHLTIGDSEDEERPRRAEPLMLDFDNHRCVIPINLMFIRPEGVAPQIQQQLRDVWSPYELTPLVLMNIYQMLEEKRAASLIPKIDDQYISSGFQPDLLDEIQRGVFNEIVGGPVHAVGPKLTEEVVDRLLEARYGRAYRTLMPVSTWRASLRNYVNALDRLERVSQRRGEVQVQGTKTEIAGLFPLSNPAFDNFIRTFDTLIAQTRDWPNQKQEREGEKGAVRFTLHPQEKTILDWLKTSTEPVQTGQVGGKSPRLMTLKLGDVYERSAALGYQSDEVEQLIDLLVQRGYVEIYKKHQLRELPIEGPDSDALLRQLDEVKGFVGVLSRGFGGHERLLRYQELIDQWRQAVEQQLQSDQPDPETFFTLEGRASAAQKALQEFAAERQKELNRRLTTMLASVSPLRPDYLTTLDRPIEGAVSYVDQINVLRVALSKQGHKVGGELIQLRSRLEQAQAALGREDIAPEDLVAQAEHLAQFEKEIARARQQRDEFDTLYQHLHGWRRLVTAGSELQEKLQEMDTAAQHLVGPFETIARDIRADISSQSQKLAALPNYNTYESQLDNLKSQLLQIRERALDDFADRQNRYRTALVNSGLYRREHLDQPFEYNFSNPGESFRLLEEYIQSRVLEVAEQVGRRAQTYRQSVKQILDTPFLRSLPAEDRDRLERDGAEAQHQQAELIAFATNVKNSAQSIENIRDFPGPNEGSFAELVAKLAQIRGGLAESDRRVRDMDTWLRQMDLSGAEQAVLERLDEAGLEELVDLVDWRASAKRDDDEFWKTVRALFEKRRVRIQVSRIRG